jgi:succinate-acetate transporter protein
MRAGGWLGLIAGFAAFYMGLSELLDEEKSVLFRLPLGKFSVRE